VRPVDTRDLKGLEEFWEGLSAESRLLRFFTGGVDVQRAAYSAAHPERGAGYAVVATTGPDDRIVAHACYERENERSDSAEVALAIADRYQGRGLGTLLLEHLADVAERQGVSLFTGQVLPQNHQMLKVLRDSGLPVERRIVAGDIEISFPTALTPEAREQFERREQTAAVAAMRHVLAPRSVAVIGASRRRGTPGGEIFHNLLAGGFTGPVYPVNAHADVVQSVTAYRSVADVPRTVDVAVIAVPAEAVVAVARECAAAGVRALIVLSAGFAETGPDGIARQRDLLTVCRQAGMRLVGPNCLGVLNTDPAIRLNAQFGPSFPAAGHVGLLSQSGALGLAIIDYANSLGLGLSTFVSAGNKADLSGNDLLRYWENDQATDVILLYLESFGNPRKFARIARRVARVKPIVAVKSGRTSAGAKAASSHTGALLQTSDRTVDALFRQAGVVRTDTLSELFDVAALLANQPVPTGHRVAIVTNAGGPGILCADACIAEGLDVVALSEQTQQALRRLLPKEAVVDNPVNTLAAVAPGDYRQTIALVGAAEEVDAVIAIYVPPLASDPDAVTAAIRAAAGDLDDRLPLAAVYMSAAGRPRDLMVGDRRVPGFAFPEDAVRAVARAADYGEWRRRPESIVPEFSDVRHDEASALLAVVAGEAVGGRWLTTKEVMRLFDCYGIPLVATRVVTTPDEAIAAARAFDRAVAVKAVAVDLVHRSDVKAVRLGLATDRDVAGAAEEIRRAVTAAGREFDGYLVQPMITDGVELIAGVTHDPTFGPVIVCGAGGTAVELVKDISMRITPLTTHDATQMLRSLATFPLLDGYRGAPKAKVSAVEDLLLRLSLLAEHQPGIAEIDCNPIIADADGAVVVDARVLVGTPRDRPTR
jgi:acetyl coenzyme A synthetase (ADP forming)-like protein